MKTNKNLILGSTSVYRKALLQQLGLPFQAMKPLFDEETFKASDLAPRDLAEALAFHKAESLKATDRIVIGGDQLVAHQGQILGKPHAREKAIAQLLSMQGQTHELITAICVFDGEACMRHTDITRLSMKTLSREQIERYVDLDTPFDCAGSYKIEKHGLMLFDKIESQDFSAIQGLPLLALSQILNKSGFSIP